MKKRWCCNCNTLLISGNIHWEFKDGRWLPPDICKNCSIVTKSATTTPADTTTMKCRRCRRNVFTSSMTEGYCHPCAVRKGLAFPS